MMQSSLTRVFLKFKYHKVLSKSTYLKEPDNFIIALNSLQEKLHNYMTLLVKPSLK
jgi:hypothetical protein